MRKKKILFFIYQMGAGGAARTLLNIINNVDRDRYQPVLVTLNFDGSYEHVLKDDVTFIKLDTKRLSRSIFKLASIIRREQIDIVFSTIPRVNTIAILARIVSFTRAKNVIREADNLGGTWKENIQLLAFGLIYRLSHQIISLSEGVKDNLVKRYKLHPKNIKVIYNPVDIENINELANTGTISPEHEALFTTDQKVLVTAGRLVHQKDHHTMLRAFALVHKDIPSKLVILGEGPLEEELLALSKELGVNEDVHFVGFQTNPYVYFQRADLFVLSSVHEGFSHVIAEALATRTPVVSTNCKSGPSEVLDNGTYGQLSEVGDEKQLARNIKQVITLEQQDISTLQEKGFERANTFHVKKIIKDYEQVFNNVL
ncbi:group 1 glycosyl transferase [Gracilibacillus halophilus YIM-C55.5]|uniref:Group 1 glycosyl transferase n=1 Tax=Gracilibacillus halophilus YIM-C55.5 TaxID=1308866 RepID=N4WU05_9BACI|nr:glycosyltransferase [Gracilibacillus halophilus]ENH96576.1 group 1 glycosyl transferase [Gracilibacillus halophilus YIM-C55.5]